MATGESTAAPPPGSPFDRPLPVPPVPAPPEEELPLLRFIATAGRNGIGVWPRRAYEAPILRRRMLGRTRVTVNDPDAVRRIFVDNAENYARSPVSIRMLRPVLGDGLLISEGAAWRHQRRTLAPAFTPRAVDALQPHILSATEEALDALAHASLRGPVDLYGALQRLALEIAGRTMFSVGMHAHGTELRAFVERYAHRHGRPGLADFLLPPRWPGPADLARARFRRRWTAFLDRVIADRGRDGGARDLLDRLGAARDPETGHAFAPDALRDQVATLILAGHETTAITLLWACVLLAQAPATQEALAAEARRDRSRDIGHGPDEGDVARRLPLTRAVIDETLRLYPPAYILTRLARGPDVLAGEAIPPGTIVIVAPWLLHRHRRLWPRPDAFDPARFLPGADPVPRFAYLPFGAGPRVCIGAAFALTETVLALSRIVGRFHLARSDDRPVLPAPVVTMQPDHAPAFTLRPRGG